MSLESSPLLDPDGLVGRVLAERYLIEERLGEGGMGTVYRAAHVKVGRSFAIKVLHPELLRNEKVVWRFEREAESAARMRHPNVVPALDVGTTEEGLRYLVMDFVDGPDLAEIMLEAPMPPPRVIWLVRQILEGLQHAHHHGLVHRDLKPQNIIVETDADGREIPRIVDFGISILASDEEDESSRLTTSGMVLGTPLYMAPEQAVAGEIDHRVDIFALGLIVYEMLSGSLPFDGTGAQVARANLMLDPPAMSKRVPDLSVDPLLEAFTRKLMARDRDRRPGSAREARELLDLIERDRKSAAAVLSVASDAAPSQILTVPRLPSVSDAPSAKISAKQVDPTAVTEISDKIPAGSAPLVMVQEEGSEVVVSLTPLGESGPTSRPPTGHPTGHPAGHPAAYPTGPSGQVDLSHVAAGSPASGQSPQYPLPYFPGDPPPMVAQPFQHGGPQQVDRRAERYMTTEHGYRHNAGRRRRWVVAGSIGSAVLGMVIIAMVVKSGPKPNPPENPEEARVGDREPAPVPQPVAQPDAAPSAPATAGAGSETSEPSPASEAADAGAGSATAPEVPPEKKADGGRRLEKKPKGNQPSGQDPASRNDDIGLGKPTPAPEVKPKPPEQKPEQKPEPVAAPSQTPTKAEFSKKYADVGTLLGKVPAGEERSAFWSRYLFIQRDKYNSDDALRTKGMKILSEIERDVNAFNNKK